LEGDRNNSDRRAGSSQVNFWFQVLVDGDFTASRDGRLEASTVRGKAGSNRPRFLYILVLDLMPATHTENKIGGFLPVEL